MPIKNNINKSDKSLSEMTYTIDEIVKSGRTGYSRILTATALKKAGETEYTLSDAKQITEEFANKPID